MTRTNPSLWPILEPEHQARFQPVLDWLDAGAPHQSIGSLEDVGFNLLHLVARDTSDHSKNPCGTVCCIGGALAAFDGAGYDDIQGLKLQEIGRILGMSWQQTDMLFTGVIRDRLGIFQSHLDMDCITPAMAAHAIRTMLTTGYPQWVRTKEYNERAEPCSPSPT